MTHTPTAERRRMLEKLAEKDRPNVVLPPTWGQMRPRTPATTLSLDIGGTLGWCLLDSATERVLDCGQEPYTEPKLTARQWLWPTQTVPAPDAVVIELPLGMAFARLATGKDAAKLRGIDRRCAINRERALEWKGYFEGRGLPVFMTTSRKKKSDRLTEVMALLMEKGQWNVAMGKPKNEHLIDALFLGLKWIRESKIIGGTNREG